MAETAVRFRQATYDIDVSDLLPRITVQHWYYFAAKTLPNLSMKHG